MSETITFTCKFCGHTTDVTNDVMILEDYSGFQCTFQSACDRRQKRDAILAEMQEMAKNPVHPVDKFSFSAISICAGALLGTIITCLLFLFGF